MFWASNGDGDPPHSLALFKTDPDINCDLSLDDDSRLMTDFVSLKLFVYLSQRYKVHIF